MKNVKSVKGSVITPQSKASDRISRGGGKKTATKTKKGKC